VPWELVGIFVQISNYKISVIQFRCLAYKCLVVLSAAQTSSYQDGLVNTAVVCVDYCA